MYSNTLSISVSVSVKLNCEYFLPLPGRVVTTDTLNREIITRMGRQQPNTGGRISAAVFQCVDGLTPKFQELGITFAFPSLTFICNE